MSTENARRYFVGVQGDRARRGELFGVSNIFALRTGDKCLTEDILQVQNLEQFVVFSGLYPGYRLQDVWSVTRGNLAFRISNIVDEHRLWRM